jgi:hypothetical protein
MPLSKTHVKAMDLINDHEEGCALFLLAGLPAATGRKSPDFERKVEVCETALVGVYEGTVDSRYVFEDLEVFYQRREFRNGLV